MSGIDPLTIGLELFGLIISGVVIFIFFLAGFSLIGAYRRVKRTENLILVIAFMMAGLGMFFLLLEKLFFRFVMPTLPIGEWLGRWSGIIAITFAFAGVALMDSFSFILTYPERAKIFTLVISIVVAIAWVVLAFAIGTGLAVIDANFELDYSTVPVVMILIPLLLLPTLFIPTIVFGYYGISIRKQSKPKMKRALTMMVGFVVLAISLIVELIGAPLLIAIIMRVGFFVFATLIYLAFGMPKFYKRWIGWEDAE